MTVKATWLWNGQAAGGEQVFGFSETWYSDDVGDTLKNKMWNLAKIRVQTLAKGTVLYGYRIGQPGGKSFTIRETGQIKPASSQSPPNVPQDAALCQAYGTAAGSPIKRFWLHNLPDDFVNDAQFNNLPQMALAAADWVNALMAQGFKFRYSILSTPARIAGITTGGIVTLSDNLAVAPGADVKLVRVRDVTGKSIKGIFRVSADPAPTATSFKILNWGGATVGPSGQVRVVSYGFSSLLGANDKPGKVTSALIKAGSRKCGRPFGQLRGRVSARR